MIEAPARDAEAHVGALLGVLSRRTRPGERPEEILLDFGLVPERELAIELAARSGRPFTGMRGVEPAPDLFLYLPLQVALAEKICPLALEGSCLTLATAFLDPDLSHIRSRFPALELQLVVAPRGDILHVLREMAARVGA